jgi:hypothetical protein
MYRSTLSWPRHYLGVSGQLHAPAVLTPGKGNPVALRHEDPKHHNIHIEVLYQVMKARSSPKRR